MAMSPENDTTPPSDASRTPKTRSCQCCAEKKIKCDRQEPCTHCKKQRTQCIFPPPGRARRKMKYSTGAHKKDLQQRLEVMEEALREMRSRNEHQKEEASLTKSEPTPEPDPVNCTGTVICDSGQSRYFSNDSALWAMVMEEIVDLKLLVTEPCDNENFALSPVARPDATKHQGFMFGFSSLAIDMSSFHPQPSQITLYWQLYLTNVDPLLKVLHAPSFASHIFTARQDLSQLSKPVEATLFAIYHSVIVSMTASEVLSCFLEEKIELLSRYRFATEQALARANFLSTRNITVLQAFALFLITSNNENDNGLSRNMTGNLVRSAQSVGLHREAAGSGISPFELEIRRRLWWNIVTLDCRTSEDHGIEPMINSTNVMLPSNLNDADLHPDMTETPQPSRGPTDITLCLIKLQLARMLSDIDNANRKARSGNNISMLNLEARGAAIKDAEAEIYATFMSNSSPADAQEHCALAGSTLIKLMTNKAHLSIYHPARLAELGVTLTNECKMLLFNKAIEMLECARTLETAPIITKWAWQSRTYVQWHAIAFLLAGLCCQQEINITSRAWRVIIGAFQEWGSDPYEQRTGLLWQPMRKLKQRVQGIWEGSYGRTVEDLLQTTDKITGNLLDPRQPTALTNLAMNGTQVPSALNSEPMYLGDGNISTQQNATFRNSMVLNSNSAIDPQARQAFNFMPMLFNLVDSTVAEDLTNIDMESWEQTELYFNMELDRLGQI